MRPGRHPEARARVAALGRGHRRRVVVFALCCILVFVRRRRYLAPRPAPVSALCRGHRLCGLTLAESFRELRGRGTLLWKTSPAMRTAPCRPPTMSCCSNNLLVLSSCCRRGRGDERGRMPPRMCNRRAPSDGARRLAVFGWLAAVETLAASNLSKKSIRL